MYGFPFNKSIYLWYNSIVHAILIIHQTNFNVYSKDENGWDFATCIYDRLTLSSYFLSADLTAVVVWVLWEARKQWSWMNGTPWRSTDIDGTPGFSWIRKREWREDQRWGYFILFSIMINQTTNYYLRQCTDSRKESISIEIDSHARYTIYYWQEFIGILELLHAMPLYSLSQNRDSIRFYNV